jgi:hypothetical protein
MIDDIKFCASERSPIGYMRRGDEYVLRLVWAEKRPEQTVKWTSDDGIEHTRTLAALPAGWALPGGKRTADKKEALRIVEAIAKAMAGY